MQPCCDFAIQFQFNRRKQHLFCHRLSGQLFLQLFIGHAFVSRMLINQDHTVVRLSQNITTVNLGKRPPQINRALQLIALFRLPYSR